MPTATAPVLEKAAGPGRIDERTGEGRRLDNRVVHVAGGEGGELKLDRHKGDGERADRRIELNGRRLRRDQPKWLRSVDVLHDPEARVVVACESDLRLNLHTLRGILGARRRVVVRRVKKRRPRAVLLELDGRVRNGTKKCEIGDGRRSGVRCRQGSENRRDRKNLS